MRHRKLSTLPAENGGMKDKCKGNDAHQTGAHSRSQKIRVHLGRDRRHFFPGILLIGVSLDLRSPVFEGAKQFAFEIPANRLGQIGRILGLKHKTGRPLNDFLLQRTDVGRNCR